MRWKRLDQTTRNDYNDDVVAGGLRLNVECGLATGQSRWQLHSQLPRASEDLIDSVSEKLGGLDCISGISK
jgi:hypothetical protein